MDMPVESLRVGRSHPRFAEKVAADADQFNMKRVCHICCRRPPSSVRGLVTNFKERELHESVF
tara:strand:- start:8888 stop:9076 length:189 start_codon:yes stop_codon:yes gene_type:complete